MLEPTEDKSNEGPSSTVGERSPPVNKTVTTDRLVYKLVKVGDDGSVLPATEDEVFQSLVEGSSAGLPPSYAGGSDVNEDDEDEEGSDVSLDSDEDDSDGKEDPSFPSEMDDLVAEKKKLLSRLQVVDTMLLRVDAEEQQRLSFEDQVGSVLGHESNSSAYLNAGDTSGDYKRQRRPNPKYFDFNAGSDPVPSATILPMTLNPSVGEAAVIGTSPEKQSSGSGFIPRSTSGWGPQRSSIRTAGAQRARTVLAQKPFIRTPSKVQAPRSVVLPAVNSMPDPSSLENLSIRELHEAFRSTYGRDTSVKDKHWLKRQISAGWSKQHDAALNAGSRASQTDLKVRPEQQLSAEQSLPSSTTATIMVSERDTVNEAQEPGRNGVESTEGLLTNELDDKQSLHRSVPLAVISPVEGFNALTPSSLNEVGAGGGQIAIFGEVVNTGKQVGVKRQRKPNRRYVEDEGESSPGTVLGNGSRPGPVGSDSGGHGLGTPSRLSWRTVVTDGPADLIGRTGTLRGPTFQNASRANTFQGQRTKPTNGTLKRKAEGRAAKLVKMAHSAARAARHDTEGSARKVKFQLPAAPGREKDGMYKLNGEAGDQVSCLLPLSSGHSADLLQPLAPDNGADAAGEQLVATVPTANGGTRRKHHRPWTLREVMTLVEGVARCGGGKWADIKKLAFSSVGYRTAVDLKDKWRNLLRASRAQLYPPKQGERKKQFTAAIPATILARVRDLAALQHQMPTGAGAAGSTSRSRRSVHRK
ncbi:unnamed protein product [Sphagnum troendelagicum]|uniref:Uncharacterized protein n=1 Tax=Sphagnum troendelagicum TaxID=128251 RepID=A0ABP0V3T9_9BRYO